MGPVLLLVAEVVLILGLRASGFSASNMSGSGLHGLEFQTVRHRSNMRLLGFSVCAVGALGVLNCGLLTAPRPWGEL